MLIIGVGNTAMDCCRTSKRIGGKDVRVIARKGRPHFKASAWELDDAEEELVEIVENHSPSRFVIENGRLVGMEFDIVEWAPDENGRLVSTTLDSKYAAGGVAEGDQPLAEERDVEYVPVPLRKLAGLHEWGPVAAQIGAHGRT